jgi:glycosyltransferase involved in cell wall biosynthesis
MEIKSLSIVIPAFNEAMRLPPTLTDLQAYELKCPLRVTEVIVVDDGSKDRTVDIVREISAKWPRLQVLPLSRNLGKGGALRAGVLRATGDLVLLADADQSTPWDQIGVLWQVLQSQNLDAVIGSRAISGSQIEVKQNFFRQTLGKTFNLILRGLTGLPFRDTQCGFKMFYRSEGLQKTFQDLSTLRFAYDVEILLMLLRQGKRIAEVPVRWAHKEESRVHLIFDSSEMLWAVLKLRWRVMLRGK